MSVYEIPGSLRELFQNGESSYKIVDHDIEMDNNEALRCFIESVEIPDGSILEDEGTRVTVKCEGFDYVAVIDSYGLGDFYTHGFDVSFLKDGQDFSST